jgi:enamine deaminase RidA (YjgF/YER057c/UK114 family)
MTREVINPPELTAVNPTYSQAIRANGFVYVAGQIGIDPATDSLIRAEIAEQARQAIENTATVLRAAGSSLENVVSTTLYLTEFDQLGKVNAFSAFNGHRFIRLAPMYVPRRMMSGCCSINSLKFSQRLQGRGLRIFDNRDLVASRVVWLSIGDDVFCI